MTIYTEASLCEAIRAFLATPPSVEPWEESWQAARLLFLLHPYIANDQVHHDLQWQLHERMDSHRIALERMSPKQWLQAVEETHGSLQHQFEQIAGDLSQTAEESLAMLLQLQKELDALQWMTSANREEEDFAIAEALADLSMLEREVSLLRRRSRRNKDTFTYGSELSELDGRIHRLRDELLARETSHFIQQTESLLPSQSQRLVISSATATRTRSRRRASRPTRIDAEEAAQRAEKTQPMEVPSIPTPTDSKLGPCWEALLQGESLLLATQLEMATSVDEQHLIPLLESLERRQQQLKSQLQAGLTPLGNDARRNWCVKHVPQMTDEIDEHLAALDDLDMAEAITHLRHMEAQMTWLLSLVNPLKESGKTSNTSFADTAKQLRRLHRRLRAEAQEKKLQGKLEARFGHRAVSFSENLILFLILLVVIFLTIEYAFNLPGWAKLALMWADTAICAVFLTEFFVKLSFAEGKGLYFRRHFLIDLLPSIPFSLIFWMIQGPAVAHVAAGRAARLARLSRIARYIRVLRPLIRIFRVLTFVMRALDRLVRKYETVFNRNVMLFPNPQESQRSKELTPEAKIQQIRDRCRKRMRMQMAKMTPHERIAFLAHRASAVENQLGGHDGESRQQGLIKHSTEIVYFDQLIEKMNTIDEIEVEEILGEGFIQQTSRLFRFLAAPGVRALPGIRRMAKAYRELSSAALVAWMIQGIGRMLERIQRMIQWVGDLYGIVTGPQVLDRIGMTLINATLRPARRLLVFGLLFLIVTLFIQAFSIGWLHDAAKFLTKFLGAPIIILGLVSLIPLALGFWFRMIAGETTDFFARISEAQFIARLKQIKHHKSRFDLKHLVLRVLHPEAMLRDKPIQQPDQLVEQLQSQLGQQGEFALRELSPRASRVDLPRANVLPTAEFHSKALTGDDAKTDWGERDRILLLYEDYLDGTPLHRSDTKTTNHLLGNITIQNIRKHRLGLNLVQNLRIEKLDLSRPRLLLYFGPYLWFASITESLTHRIARLIVEYNQNCIPHDELAWLEQEEREEYEQWLVRREKRLAGIPLPPERQKKDENEFRTTAFTALHFLSAEPARDNAVGQQFGQRLVALMQAERRLLMRELFGYYPFHQLPKEQRTFNLFQSYQRHVARGRFFLLPFKMVWWFGKAIVWSVKRIHKLVRDVLQPPSHVETEVHGKSGFDVAIRKINRMRKPIYTECMRLRASFDLEYLGFFLPGRAESGLEGNHYISDLEFIGASAREALEFEQLRARRERQLILFDAFLEERGWKGDALYDTLGSIHPQLAAKHGEVLRALTAAFASDYQSVRSLLEAHKTVDAFFLDNPTDEQEEPPKLTRWQRTQLTIQRMFKTFFFIRKDKEMERFTKCWEAAPRRHSVERDWDRYLAQREALKPHFKLLANTDGDPVARATEIFEDVIKHSSIWTEEILTLRTLQTLTQLDIQLYRELVHTIGAYEHGSE